MVSLEDPKYISIARPATPSEQQGAYIAIRQDLEARYHQSHSREVLAWSAHVRHWEHFDKPNGERFMGGASPGLPPEEIGIIMLTLPSSSSVPGQLTSINQSASVFIQNPVELDHAALQVAYDHMIEAQNPTTLGQDETTPPGLSPDTGTINDTSTAQSSPIKPNYITPTLLNPGHSLAVKRIHRAMERLLDELALGSYVSDVSPGYISDTTQIEQTVSISRRVQMSLTYDNAKHIRTLQNNTRSYIICPEPDSVNIFANITICGTEGQVSAALIIVSRYIREAEARFAHYPEAALGFS